MANHTTGAQRRNARRDKIFETARTLTRAKEVDSREPAEPITPVLFRVKRGKQYADDGVTAVFPCEPATLQGDTMTCYAHVGQHGACGLDWYNQTRAAKPEEYAPPRARA